MRRSTRRAAAAASAGVADPRLHNRPGLAALRYRVGTHGDFLRRMLRAAVARGIEAADVCAPARHADHAQRPTIPRSRCSTRWARRRRRADLLPGAHRQRGLPAHRDRAALGAGAGARDRLRARARRRRQRPPGVHGRGRARRARLGDRCRRARGCRACRGRASCRRRSRRATRSPRAPSGTRCARGRCGRRNWRSATASW